MKFVAFNSVVVSTTYTKFVAFDAGEIKVVIVSNSNNSSNRLKALVYHKKESTHMSPNIKYKYFLNFTPFMGNFFEMLLPKADLLTNSSTSSSTFTETTNTSLRSTCTSAPWL